MTWTGGIRLGETVWRLDDLTLVGADQVCRTCECGWAELDPVRFPGHLGALVAAFLASDGEVTFEQGLVAAGRLRLAEGVALLVFGDDEDEEVGDGIQ